MADQRHAVAVGQPEVDHDHVRPIDRQVPARRVQAVGAPHPRAALGGEQPDRLGGAAAVLDQQDRHREQALTAQASERAELGLRHGLTHGTRHSGTGTRRAI